MGDAGVATSLKGNVNGHNRIAKMHAIHYTGARQCLTAEQTISESSRSGLHAIQWPTATALRRIRGWSTSSSDRRGGGGGHQCQL